MNTKQYDLVVIGSGPAGEKGAAQAAYFGKKVAVIERNNVGGVMANSAVPGKGLRETSLFINSFKQRELHGIQLSQESDLDVSKVLHRSSEIRETLVNTVELNLQKHGVDVYHGSASFQDSHTIVVTDKAGTETVISASFFLIATGSSPFRPPVFPFAASNVYDSDTIFSMGKPPASLTIVGAGTIGCEYACIFNQLRVQVNIIDPQKHLLPFADKEISGLLRTSMENGGIKLFLSDSVERMESDGTTVTTYLKSGKVLTTEAAFISVGRRSNVTGLNLDVTGVTTSERGLLLVNAHFQTSAGHIYAAGDVIGFPALASTSMEQARTAIVHAFDLQYKDQVAKLLPLGVWTIPEISVVGETEESLTQKGLPYVVGRASYTSNSRGMVIGEKEGLLKLIFSVPEHQLVGVHIIGEQACELISPGMIALTLGADFNTFIQTCFNFPSLAEMYKYATYDAMNNARIEDNPS